MLIQYLIAVGVMEAEDCIEPNLFDFFMNGPRHISPETKLPKEDRKGSISWMNKVIWADLVELSKLRPFSNENLIEHITSHKTDWTQYRGENYRSLCFFDLPNRSLLNLNFFKNADKDQIAKLNRQALKEDDKASQEEVKPKTPGTNRESRTPSEERPHTKGGTSLKRTESEILNDPEIWDISSSEGIGSDKDLVLGEVKEENIDKEEIELARYLVESCPG